MSKSYDIQGMADRIVAELGDELTLDKVASGYTASIVEDWVEEAAGEDAVDEDEMAAIPDLVDDELFKRLRRG